MLQPSGLAVIHREKVKRDRQNARIKCGPDKKKEVMDSDEDEDDALDEEAFKPPQPRKLMPAPTKRTPAAPSTKAKAVGKKTAEELMKVRQANASYALPPPSQLAGKSCQQQKIKQENQTEHPLPKGWEKRLSRSSGFLFKSKSQWDRPIKDAEELAKEPSKVRCFHILVKHEGSRNPAGGIWSRTLELKRFLTALLPFFINMVVVQMAQHQQQLLAAATSMLGQQQHLAMTVGGSNVQHQLGGLWWKDFGHGLV
uniref:Peptidylprolyl isomerase n=1 Tax=Meloidogyne hapla TaxID=6305 RepID=A0A1I8BEJ8_MELHA